MKHLFNNRVVKTVCTIVALLVLGIFIAAVNGHGETAQSTVVGTVFQPCHYVAQKISDGLDKAFGSLSGNAEYEKQIDSLEEQIGDLRSQLVDYENLKNQNTLYKEFLELKEEHKDYKFAEASVIGRDSADTYDSFTINLKVLRSVTRCFTENILSELLTRHIPITALSKQFSTRLSMCRHTKLLQTKFRM